MNQVEVLRKQIQYYSYVFGAIVLLMFGQMIGNNGVAYLAIAMETMGLFMVLLGDNVAEVFGKMLRFRRKRKQFNDALIVKKRIMLLQSVLGAVCFGAVFLLADMIAAALFQIPNAALIIRVLSPVLFLRMLSTLLIGYFQGLGAQMPAMFGSVLRQVLFLILGKLLCGGFLAYGEKVSALLKNEDFYGMYGAVGLALSMVISEVVILIALVIFYFIGDRNYDRKRCENGLHKAERMQDTLQGFYGLGAAGMGYAFFKRFFVLAALIMLVTLEDMGIYYGKYLLLCAIPVLFVGARYYILYARLVSAIKNKNGRQVREKLQIGLQYAWSAGILAVMLMAVLAPYIVNAYFPEDTVLLSMLQRGSLLILAVILLAYLIMVQSAHKKKLVSLLTLLGGAVLFVILSTLMGGKPESQPLAVVYAGVISLYIAVIVLGAITISQYHLKLEYVPVFIMPLVCVGVVGVIVLLISKLLVPHIGNGVTCLLGILLGIALYLAALGVCRVFSENEIEQIYGRFGKKILAVIFK